MKRQSLCDTFLISFIFLSVFLTSMHGECQFPDAQWISLDSSNSKISYDDVGDCCDNGDCQWQCNVCYTGKVCETECDDESSCQTEGQRRTKCIPPLLNECVE